MCDAIAAGHSVLVLGEVGAGITEFAHDLLERFTGELTVAIATYKGSGKKFFQQLAQQLDIPTEDAETGRALTMELLKEEIASNLHAEMLFLLPEARRLPTSIRYWLEDAIAAGVRVVCFAPVNPGRDIFLEMLEVELDLPPDTHIRNVMAAEAKRHGLELSQSRLAELQPLAGRNPMLARKLIRHEAIGLAPQRPEHTQYIVVMPIIIACLMAFGIVRFIGMGTGNKALYITGGVTLVTGMTLKQLGSIRGARKRLGQ